MVASENYTSNTREHISIVSCFNSMHLRLPTSLTPGFKHGFRNLQEQHFACWCEDFFGQRLWTYLSTDTWVAMHSQECNGTLVSNEVVDFVILLCWILTGCFGDIWCFLTKKKWGHPVRCIKDTLSIPSLFEFDTFFAKSSCIQPYVSRSRFLQKAVEIPNWLHHNHIWGVGLQQ